MIKWIILDAMGVLFEVGDDTNDLLVPFVRARNPAISGALVNAAYLRASLGEMRAGQFWQSMGLGDLYPKVEEAYLDTQLTLNRGVVAVIESLTTKYQIGLLSNDVSEWSVHLRKKHRLNFFSAIAVSGDVHLRKPDPGIYEAFLRIADATGPECVFVDDRTRNLIPARSLGMRTILFGGDTQDTAFVPDASVERADWLASAISNLG